MVAAPSGTVTFLFTDVEGSTRLLDRLGDDYADVLALHHRVLREVWSSHRGYEVDGVGDSFMVAFADAADAVAAAGAAQRALAEVGWPHGEPVRVRMGLHTGYAEPREGRYYAMAVHQAARVVNAANGGQVVVSAATREALGGALESGLVDLGLFQVRDFASPQRLFGLVAQGWTSDSRALRVRPAEFHNLVPPMTALVGREELIERIDADVRPGSLTTLVGAGGVGKTRAAVEFGLRHGRRWAEGVWMVPLEALSSAQEIAEELAGAINAPTVAGRPALEDALLHLADKQAALIFDNCEHVADEAAQVIQAIRSRCPGVGILTTSQVPLHLAAERLLQVEPLSTGAHGAALDLFVERAGAQTDLNAAAEICDLVNGLPLAIELAAARSMMIPADMVLEQLRIAPSALDSRDPTVGPRHRSIHAVVQWGLDLLEADTLLVLQHLTVLAGSFTLAEAEAASATEVLAGRFTAGLVWDLTERSLLTLDNTGGETRFHMMTSVRETASAGQPADQRRAAVFALAAHYAREMSFEASLQYDWNRRVLGALTNIRGVIRELPGLDDRLGQLLAWGTLNAQRETGAIHGCRVDADEYLELFATECPERVGVLNNLIACMTMLPDVDPETFTSQLEEGRALEGRVGRSKQLPSLTWAALEAVMAEVRGDAAGARALLEPVLATTADPVDRQSIAIILATACLLDGDADAAAPVVAVAQQYGLGPKTDIYVTGLSADIHRIRGEFAQAARTANQFLSLARVSDSLSFIGESVRLVGQIALDTARWGDGLALTTASITMHRESGLETHAADREQTDRDLHRAAAALLPDAYAQAVARGNEWTMTEACDFAARLCEIMADEPDPVGSAI